jgi:imidazolonepropionase-like amidohydrolase
MSAQAQTLVIEGGTLINGTGGTPLDNAVVVIEGSRIKAVGSKGKVSYPPNSRVIKEEGKFILPGLIDVNTHYRGWDPQMFLHYGVTTAYDGSGPTEWMVAQRDMINHGKIKGPRLFVGGWQINGPLELSRLSADQSVGTFHVATPEEAREAVRKNTAGGVDFIHVEEAVSPELLKAIIDEARKYRVTVIGHTRDIHDSALAGLTYMEHSVPLAHAVFQAEDPKKVSEVDWQHVEFPGAEYRMNTQFYGPLIKLMASKGVSIDPTFGLQWRAVNPRAAEWSAVIAEIAKEPGIEFVPADVRESWTRPPRKPNQSLEELAEGLKKVQEFVRQYSQAGGRVLTGTDSMGLLSLQGISMSFEMQSLVDAGVSPMQAIVAATKSAAEAGHKDKDLGTIEPGKFADLFVVDENPLNNITAIRKVALVVKDGQVIDRTYDPKFVNPIPRINFNGQLKGPDNGPELSALTPVIAREGDNELTIKVTGKRFGPQSVVRFNSTDLKTQFVSDSQLTAVVPKSILQKVGSYVVTVANGDWGVKSNLRSFIVNFKY